jgi:hypothetical protein
MPAAPRAATTRICGVRSLRTVQGVSVLMRGRGVFHHASAMHRGAASSLSSTGCPAKAQGTHASDDGGDPGNRYGLERQTGEEVGPRVVGRLDTLLTAIY